MSLIGELEQAVASGTPEKRIETLRRITDLFLNEADRLNDEQIAVFDDVLLHLVQAVETKALAQLSSVLAPIDNAPIETIRRLAHNDEINVAGPILSQSSRLTDSDLVQIASSKGQSHLLAISTRSSLSEAVTDILVDRGNREVALQLATNANARFSNFGYSSMVERAKGDEALSLGLGQRLDIPLQFLRRLLERASDIVRSRLLAVVSPERQADVLRALESIASAVRRENTIARDFSGSESAVARLNREGKLNEQVLLGFANSRQYENTIATLALFCGAPSDLIWKLAQNVNPEGLLTACKAAKLSWPTALAVLSVRFSHHSMTEAEISAAKSDFIALSQASAQRTMRFMLVQATARK